MPPRKRNSKEKLKRWSSPERAKLRQLIEEDKVDPTDLSIENIKYVNTFYPERTYAQFAQNFKNFSAEYTTGEEYDGARLEASSKSYLVYRIILALLAWIISYSF